MIGLMTCCTLIVAATLAMGYGDAFNADHATFATPMFLRGQAVWVTPVSRRQLLLNIDKHDARPARQETEVALVLA
jgi:hypothetical protein